MEAVAADRSAGYRVDADAGAAEFEGQGFGEADQAALGGGVPAAVRIAEAASE